jgi:hypothetical protein
MNRFKATAMILCLCLVAVVLSTGAQADTWNKTTVVTFSQPVEVPGVGAQVLPAGTYVFRLMDSRPNRHIVQIWNREESHIFTTILAIPNWRVKPTSKTVITFGERGEGQPEAIRTWFYPGDNLGQEFVYPKARAIELAKVSGEPVLAMPLETEPTVEALKEVPVVTVTPAGEVVPAAQVAETLPQTSSLLPLAGLVGLLSMGMSFALGALAKRKA